MLGRFVLASLLFYMFSAIGAPLQAVQPSEVLADPALETRARELSKNLRCAVCQNQSIDDSNAPLARDLRLLLRERLEAGDTDDAVIEYIVARYGQFVLLKPPVQNNTLLLWFGPGIIFVLALLAYWTLIRKHPGKRVDEASRPLTAAERKELHSIIEESPTQ